MPPRLEDYVRGRGVSLDSRMLWAAKVQKARKKTSSVLLGVSFSRLPVHDLFLVVGSFVPANSSNRIKYRILDLLSVEPHWFPTIFPVLST